MNYNWRRTFVLAMACLLCVAGYAGASTRATSGTASDGGTARLIVYRIPTIGKFVIVQVYVDDVVVGSMGYGGTYEGFLKPGHHVLSALATPVRNGGNARQQSSMCEAAKPTSSPQWEMVKEI